MALVCSWIEQCRVISWGTERVETKRAGIGPTEQKSAAKTWKGKQKEHVGGVGKGRPATMMMMMKLARNFWPQNEREKQANAACQSSPPALNQSSQSRQWRRMTSRHFSRRKRKQIIQSFWMIHYFIIFNDSIKSFVQHFLAIQSFKIET